MIAPHRKLITLLPLLMTAFMPMEPQPINTDSYYNLRFLKNAQPPREMKLIRLDNATRQTRVEQGILVSYKNRDARSVSVSGDFTLWKNTPMSRGEYGVWYYFITDMLDSPSLRYKYIVDGIWTRDPKNFNSDDDGSGSYVSLIYPGSFSEGTHLTYRVLKNAAIEFRIYRPHARLISLVGDFNNWNPENDLLEKGRDGVWRLRKRLYPGTYRYKYIIDGTWSVDLYNRDSASDATGDVCSIIRIPR